jgi:hypothetical protein
MDVNGNHHFKWNKPNRERQTLHVLSPYTESRSNIFVFLQASRLSQQKYETNTFSILLCLHCSGNNKKYAYKGWEENQWSNVNETTMDTTENCLMLQCMGMAVRQRLGSFLGGYYLSFLLEKGIWLGIHSLDKNHTWIWTRCQQYKKER